VLTVTSPILSEEGRLVGSGMDLEYEKEVERIFSEDRSSPPISQVAWVPTFKKEELSIDSESFKSHSEIQLDFAKQEFGVVWEELELDPSAAVAFEGYKRRIFRLEGFEPRRVLGSGKGLAESPQFFKESEFSNPGFIVGLGSLDFWGASPLSLESQAQNGFSFFSSSLYGEKWLKFSRSFQTVFIWQRNHPELHSINYSMQCESFRLKSMTAKSVSAWKLLCLQVRKTCPSLESKAFLKTHSNMNRKKSLNLLPNTFVILSTWSSEMRGKDFPIIIPITI